MLSRIAEAGSLDGVLLELRGSMVVGNLDNADGLDDAEGHILASVRELVSTGMPVLAQVPTDD